MEVITADSKLFRGMMERLQTLEGRFRDLVRETARRRWLSNDEVLHLLNVSKSTLQSWRDRGLIGFAQVGQKIFYLAADVEEFIQRHRREPFF